MFNNFYEKHPKLVQAFAVLIAMMTWVYSNSFNVWQWLISNVMSSVAIEQDQSQLFERMRDWALARGVSTPQRNANAQYSSDEHNGSHRASSRKLNFVGQT
jgi:hypothetical protein